MLASMRWNPRRVLGLLPRNGGGPAGTLATLARAGGPATAVVETVGFWAAVLLPLCYVPLLLTGLSDGGDAILLAVLVVLHLISLTVGHTHNRT